MQLLPLPNCQRTAARLCRPQRASRHSPCSWQLDRATSVRDSPDPFTGPGGAAHPIGKCGSSRPETFIRTVSVFVNLWYQKAYSLFYRNLAMACQPGFAEFFSFFASTLLWRWGDSNPRHRGCKPRALPLSYIPVALIFVTPTGRTWIRTKDLSFIRAAL